MSESKRYKYFDTPEGQDVHKKLWFVLRPAGLTALALSTVDVMAYSRPKGYLQTLARYAYISFPIIGSAAAFVIVANLAVNTRKKDDKLNWIIGAVAAGTVVGAWKRSTPFGFTACCAFSLVAILKKHCLQQGWTVFPPSHSTALGGLHASRYDWTLTKERPRNWTTVAPSE